MDDSSVETRSGEAKVAILMFSLLALVVVLCTFGAYTMSGSLMIEEEISRGEALVWVGQEYISMVMFVTLALLLFSGYPVASFGRISYAFWPTWVFPGFVLVN